MPDERLERAVLAEPATAAAAKTSAPHVVSLGSEETFSASQHKIGEQMAAKRDKDETALAVLVLVVGVAC